MIGEKEFFGKYWGIERRTLLCRLLGAGEKDNTEREMKNNERNEFSNEEKNEE